MIHIKLTEVTVSLLPETHVEYRRRAVKVVYQGNDLWRVVNSGYFLGADGTWSPGQSEDGDDWYEQHQFDYDTAHRLAIEVAPTLTLNGLTAAEIAARYEQ